MVKKKVRQEKSGKMSIIEALSEAQKLTFAPLTFQAVSAMIDLGILKFLSNQSASIYEIMSELNLDEYTVKTLLQVAETADIVKKDADAYSITTKGEVFLYDDMTVANFNFIKDVCYLGASELANSFKTQKPAGLNKFVEESETIYPLVPTLPEKMRNSWYEFDHLYSDNCFNEIFNIIKSNFNKIYDIGGNTGKFEKVCLSHDENFDITMLDLQESIEFAKKDEALSNCKFIPVNVLDKEVKYPKVDNSAILMSQFLDCFSKEQISKILTDLHKVMDNSSKIYILEPFTDNQDFEAAKYSLVHVSLYFTCMANGQSKMYEKVEMVELIENANLEITSVYKNIGAFDYTLLECKKR